MLKRMLTIVTRVAFTTVALIPIALCFGIVAKDQERFVHNLFCVGIYGLLIGILSLVAAICVDD